jgi:uncharacterized RDD family membrane protein YckC
MTTEQRHEGRGRGARPGRVAFGLLLLLLRTDTVFAQCALCRDALAAAPSLTREAMNYAIVGLAFTPYAVAALAAWTLSPTLRAYLRGRLRQLTTGRGGPLR